jgi:hypothetical protein
VLLSSNHKSYLEVMPIFYRENQFVISMPQAIMNMPNCMPLHRLASIQYLHFDAYMPGSMIRVSMADRLKAYLAHWVEACCIIAQDMPGLRVLRITFSPFAPMFQDRFTDESFAETLLPVLAMKVPDFTVEFSWIAKLDGAMRMLELNVDDLPFLLRLGVNPADHHPFGPGPLFP